jgi:diguanylate cyclase (GGDEF)-like protein
MGASFCVVSAFVALSTMWLLPHRESLEPAALADVAMAAAALLLALQRPRVTLPSRWLLVYPGLIALSVLTTAIVSTSVGSAYTGLLTLGFIYVGFTQPRGTGIWLVPLAAPLWWFCQTTAATLTAVRLPISVAIWVIVSEVLASRAISVRTQLDRLSDDAHTDHLTGLGNRRGLDEALEGLEIGDAVVLIDLDDFKAVNDTYGHEAGDRVLKDFATTLRASLRADDLAFRFGGEELVVIMRHGDSTADGAVSLLERVRDSWTALHRPTFSAGTSVHRGGSTAETVNRADGALYEAKRSGRDAWKIAPPIELRLTGGATE